MHGLAVVGIALAAIAAHAAGACRVQRHAVAGLDPRHRRAHFQHLARGLVAGRQRFADDEVAHPAVPVVVQVRAADAHGLHAHAHLRGAQRLGRHFRQAQVLRAMDFAIQHEVILVSVIHRANTRRQRAPHASVPRKKTGAPIGMSRSRLRRSVDMPWEARSASGPTSSPASCGVLRRPVRDACGPRPCAAIPGTRAGSWPRPCRPGSRRSCCPGSCCPWGRPPGP